MEALWDVKNPVTISFRPLTGGMRPDLHPAGLDKTQLLDAQGCIIDTVGIRRSPGMVVRFGSSACAYPPVEALIEYVDSTGYSRAIVVDTKFCYEASSSGLVRRYKAYNTGTAKTSGTYLVGSGTSWVSGGVRPGDVVKIGSGASLEQIQIYSVVSNTVATLSKTPAYTHPSGPYEIQFAFAVPFGERLDYTQLDRRLVLTDRMRPPMYLSGSVINFYSASMVSLNLVAGATAYHADRLWFGDIQIGSTRYPQRILWSSTINHANFGIIGTQQFVDRPYRPGRLLRIVPLGQYLVVYYEDAIDFGRPSNIAGDSLPFAWERIETGGLGLLGPRAIYAYNEGHFFLSQNGAYYLSLAGGLKRLEEGLLEPLIRACAYPQRAFVHHDPKRNRIVFGIPGNSDSMSVLYSFQLDSKAWSREQAGISCIGPTLPWAVTIAGLDSLVSTITDLDTISRTISALGISRKDPSISVGREDGLVYTYDDTMPTNFAGQPIQVLLETGDLDLDEPDRIKSAYRLGIRLDTKATQDLLFTVQGSVTSGDSWTMLGTIRIEQGTREGFCNFQLTGSVLRFRILTNAEVSTFRIIEWTLRLRGRGAESYFTQA